MSALPISLIILSLNILKLTESCQFQPGNAVLHKLVNESNVAIVAPRIKTIIVCSNEKDKCFLNSVVNECPSNFRKVCLHFYQTPLSQNLL